MNARMSFSGRVKALLTKSIRSAGPSFCSYFLFKKTTTIITCACFLYTSALSPVLYGFTGNRAVSQYPENEISRNFSIPDSFGSITDSHNYGSRDLIIVIHDLHCNPEVQKNIAGIIRYYDSQQGIARIFAEGAPEGKIDISYLSSIPDENVKNRTVTALLNKGILSGSEYYSITNNKDILYGLEDWNLYVDNFKRLRTLLYSKADNEATISSFNNEIRKLKNKYISRKVNNLDSILSRKRDEKYYLRLGKMNDKYDAGLPLYPNLAAYITAIRLNHSIDKSKLSIELNAYMRDLRRTVPNREYSYLTGLLGNAKADDFYISLSNVTRSNRINITDRYPNLNKFLASIDLNNSLNRLQLVTEDRMFREALLMKYSDRILDKEILFLCTMTNYLRDFVDLRITPEEYNYFASNISNFKMLLNKYFDEQHFIGITKLLDDQERVKYFNTNLERNKAFYNTLQKVIAENNKHPGTPKSPFSARAPEQSYSESDSGRPPGTSILLLLAGSIPAW